MKIRTCAGQEGKELQGKSQPASNPKQQQETDPEPDVRSQALWTCAIMSQHSALCGSRHEGRSPFTADCFPAPKQHAGPSSSASTFPDCMATCLPGSSLAFLNGSPLLGTLSPRSLTASCMKHASCPRRNTSTTAQLSNLQTDALLVMDPQSRDSGHYCILVSVALHVADTQGTLC